MLPSNEYKSKADDYAINMKKCFEESQDAWKKGDKAKAKDFSIKGNQYKALLLEANKNFTDAINLEKIQQKNTKIKENVISNLVLVKDMNDKLKNLSADLENGETDLEEKYKDINALQKSDYEDSTQNAYNYHRDQANDFAKKMGEAFNQAKLAWDVGDKAKAKEFSNFGHEYKKMMEIHNSNAVKLIATKNNIQRDSDEIDLHGLYVNEAIQFFKETLLIKMKDENFKSLRVIVGKGLHSKDKPKLKEAIVNFANEHKLQVYEHPENYGCLIICF